MSHYELHDSIVALSTPRGKSGLAVVRLSGPDVIAIVGNIVTDVERLFTACGNSSFYTTIVDSARVNLDDVVVTVFRAPRSYTGEDIVEISCHGSEAIIDAMLGLLTSLGCRVAEPGEFSLRAFYNEKLSFEDVEVLLSKLDAIDLASLHGASLAVQEKFEVLRNAYDGVIGVLAHVNAQIDFGESDEIAIEGLELHLTTMIDSLEYLLRRSTSKFVNKGHFTVAIVGPPNVGKSSLFNTLLSFERSIVSEIPGTTRDYLEAFINLEGHRVKLIDTAGERIADDSIESEGIERGRGVRRSADLVLFITDPLTRNLTPGEGEILIHNKADLDGWSDRLSVSALSGTGIDELRNILLMKAKTVDQIGYSVSESEIASLERVLVALKNSILEDELPILAEQLREAISELATLLGFNVSEDTLNHIFQQMCIGK